MAFHQGASPDSSQPWHARPFIAVPPPLCSQQASLTTTLSHPMQQGWQGRGDLAQIPLSLPPPTPTQQLARPLGFSLPAQSSSLFSPPHSQLGAFHGTHSISWWSFITFPTEINKCQEERERQEPVGRGSPGFAAGDHTGEGAQRLSGRAVHLCTDGIMQGTACILLNSASPSGKDRTCSPPPPPWHKGSHRQTHTS